MNRMPFFVVPALVIVIVSVGVLATTLKYRSKKSTYTLDIGICDRAIDLGRHIYLVKCNDKYDIRSFKSENGTLKPSVRGINLTKQQFDKLCDFPFLVKE